MGALLIGVLVFVPTHDKATVAVAQRNAFCSILFGVLSVLGFPGVIPGILAVICGHAAIHKGDVGSARIMGLTKGVAIAGLACGYLAVIVYSFAVLSVWSQK